MKICVIGLGYIGLPTAALFASNDFDVVGVDIDSKIVDTINRGEIHIEEPGLSELVKRVVEKGSLVASIEPVIADVYIIAVPTPNNEKQYMGCDLTFVLDACNSILPYLKNKSVIIVESTMAPRSMDDFIKPLFEKNGYKIGEDLYLAHCPERVLPGRILDELVKNNRIVGGITEACTNKASEVYKKIVKGEIIKTNARTAEMSKCMENTFRDVNIALANELTKICIDLKINVLDVIEMANKHPRVNIHNPSPGVGGHCLAVDPYFIYAKSPKNANIIKLARDINNDMPKYVFELTQALLSKVENPKIAIFGITYKGNVDDLRESPALKIVDLLKSNDYHIAIHDPHVKLDYIVDVEEATKDADLILILSDHDEFKNIDHVRLAELMRRPILFDTKNVVCNKTNSKLTVINFGNIHDYLAIGT